jgi:hypothetical protein
MGEAGRRGGSVERGKAAEVLMLLSVGCRLMVLGDRFMVLGDRFMVLGERLQGLGDRLMVLGDKLMVLDDAGAAFFGDRGALEEGERGG